MLKQLKHLTEVLSADGDNSELEVLRIGTFSITQDETF